MDTLEAIKAFFRLLFDDTTILLVAALALAPLLDWLFGVLRALRDTSFKWDALDVFIRTQLAGRSLPLILLLLIGRVISVSGAADVKIPGLDWSLVTTGAIAPAVIYLGLTLKSIAQNATADISRPAAVPRE